MDTGRTRTLTASAIVGTLLALAAFVAPADAAEGWRAPVDGPVVRGFDVGADPFEPGRHRGADFAAPPGETVRAACSGKVVVAGRVGSSGRVVTIRCGAWRATHMPLAAIAVHTGATIHRGATIGTLAPSTEHAGLHLGARRDGNRFGYTDPLRLIGHDPATPPPVAWRRAPRGPTPRPAPPAVPQEPAQRSHEPVQRGHEPVPRGHERVPRGRVVGPPYGAQVSPVAAPTLRASSARSSPLAPWPAWAGLAALLAGAFGTGVRLRVRARERRVAAPVASAQEAR